MKAQKWRDTQRLWVNACFHSLLWLTAVLAHEDQTDNGSRLAPGMGRN
jgi:hypothetical protein